MPRFPNRTKSLPPPIPPVTLPPARTICAPGRGELFVRDTGGDGPPVMLLHGWTVSADLNWWAAYSPLVEAGYRVLAIDHRGHGRGLRSTTPFRLADCAEDTAAALELLEASPAVVVGYSMGGAIAQLLARDHAAAVSGLVLSATAQDWQDARQRWIWRAMGLLWLILALAPGWAWRHGLQISGFRDPRKASWLSSELLRSSASAVAEAGRELGRFDSRAWIGSLGVPAAVVVTTKDILVTSRKQHGLAAALGAPAFEVALNHLEVVQPPYAPVLLQAIEAVSASEEPATRKASVLR